MQIGDKCKMADSMMRKLKLDELMPARWTVVDLDGAGRPKLEMEHPDVEVTIGPLLPAMYSAWTEADEVEWIEARKLDAEERLPPAISELLGDLDDIISDTQLVELDASKLIEARDAIKAHLVALGVSLEDI